MGNDRHDSVRALAGRMRKKAIEMAYAAGNRGAHLGAGLSAMEILACLYGGVMNVDPQNPQKSDRDYFIPSKAHCVLAFYTALAYTGFFPAERLDTFEADGGDLPGHPMMDEAAGIEFSGGSLGMGLSWGVGLCLAAKRKGIPNRAFVLLGDGECDEGEVWEAAMSAAHFGLDNLIAIVDRNRLQYDGRTDDIMSLGDLSEKFRAFGFSVHEADGHDVGPLYDALARARDGRNGKPAAVIAHTVKGKGVSFMEGAKEWHHAVLTKEKYEKALEELCQGVDV